MAQFFGNIGPESGLSSRPRFVSGGRAEIKNMLFIAAMAASKTKSALGDMYRRLIEKGKKKIIAIIAVARKILVIANAKLRDHYRIKALVID